MGEAKAERWTRKNFRVRSSHESEADQVSGARSGRACLCVAGASDPLLERGRRAVREREGRKLRAKKETAKGRGKWEREVVEVAAIMRTTAQVSGLSSELAPLWVLHGFKVWMESSGWPRRTAEVHSDCGLPRGGTLKTSEQRDTV